MAKPFPDPKGDETPQCVIEGSASLTIDFMTSSGRIYGFPYAHLLHFTLERNPHAAAENVSSGQVPLDRFSFFFSTHEVRLLGWRLLGLIPLLRHAKLLSVRCVEPRYYGLSQAAPFVSDIEVIANE